MVIRVVAAFLALGSFFINTQTASAFSGLTRTELPNEQTLLETVYAPAKSYIQSLKEVGQNDEIPFTFDLIANPKGNTIFVSYKPDANRDEATPVAMLRDNNNDGWIDEFKDERGWHKASGRADWIIYNQITPEAFDALKKLGKSQMAIGMFTVTKDVSIKLSTYVSFTSRHLQAVQTEVEQELDLIDQAKQELETLEFGSEQYTFLRNLISQHQVLLNDYLISTSAYQTAGLIGLDVMLLAPGVLTKIATPFARLCTRLGKVITEAKAFTAAGEMIGNAVSKVKVATPEWIGRSAVIVGGAAKATLAKSSALLKLVIGRLGLTRKIVMSPGFESFLTKYFPVNELLLPELRPILIRNLSWAFSTTLWAEVNSRGDRFFVEFDEVIQHMAVSLTFSAISSPYVLRPASGSKAFQKIFLSFAYAGTDATLAQLRIEGFQLPSKEQTDYLLKKETMSVIWGMTAQNNYSLATDEVSRTFQELRNAQPQNKVAIGIAEGIFRLVTRVYNQSMMRLSQRQMVGYKASEKKGKEEHKPARSTDVKREPLQMPTDIRPYLNH